MPADIEQDVSLHKDVIEQKDNSVRNYKQISRYDMHVFFFLLLKLEDLVLLVTKLLQDTCELTLVLGADLSTRDRLVHSGGTADEELDVLRLRLRKNSLQQFLRDVALTLRPALRGVVKEMEDLESLGIGVLELTELLAEKNVVLVDVAVDERDLGFVLGVGEDLAGQLVHGGDTSTASNQGNLLVLVSLPGILGKGTLEVKSVAGLKAVDVV